MLSLLTDICTTVTQLTSGILSFKESVDSFYEYVCVQASHEVYPLIVLLF